MKLKLIQYYTPNCTYAVTSEKINREYCEKYNIEYFSETDEKIIIEGVEARAVQWYKIKLIKKEILNTAADYVVFMDADAVFVNTQKDIRDIIKKYEGKELLITEDFGPDIVNTGVMIFKNTEWAVDFLDRVWEAGNRVSRGRYRMEIWHEQTIVSAFMQINQVDRQKTEILYPGDEDSINDNILRKDKTFIYHDLSKKRIEEIEKINSGRHDIITELNISCESDRHVSHKYGSYYNFHIKKTIEAQGHISILDIGGDKGVIFDIIIKQYPELEYYNITDEEYKKQNEKINLIVMDKIDEPSIDAFITSIDREFDVIIADYKHQCVYRDLFFLKFFPKLKPKGIFVIEDLQTDLEIKIPEKNNLYKWGDPFKKSMTDLIKQFNQDSTFKSDYYDFKELENKIEEAKIVTMENEFSTLGVITKK